MNALTVNPGAQRPTQSSAKLRSLAKSLTSAKLFAGKFAHSKSYSEICSANIHGDLLTSPERGKCSTTFYGLFLCPDISAMSGCHRFIKGARMSERLWMLATVTAVSIY